MAVLRRDALTLLPSGLVVPKCSNISSMYGTPWRLVSPLTTSGLGRRRPEPVAALRRSPVQGVRVRPRGPSRQGNPNRVRARLQALPGYAPRTAANGSQ